MTFAAILAGAEPLADGLAIEVPETWLQGRTAYGGFTTALALVAARQVGADLPPLRSCVVSFIGPAAGRLEARARVLRRGRNAIWVEARVEAANGIALTGTFVFMAGVSSQLSLDQASVPAGLVPVDAAVPVECPPVAPAFMRHELELRHAVPRSAGPQPDICRWLRTRREGEGQAPLDVMLDLVLCGDGLPPAVLPLIKPATPVSSMTWQWNILTDQPVTRDGWWLLRSTGDFARNGCSSQRMQAWNSDGVPMAIGMQSVALFG